MTKNYQQAPDQDDGETRLPSLAATATAPIASALEDHSPEPENRRRVIACVSLAVCATLVAFSWLVSASAVFNAHTLENAGFAPFGHSVMQDVYMPLAYLFAAVVVIVGVTVSAMLCTTATQTRAQILNLQRHVLLIASGCFLLALVAAHIDALGYADSVTSREAELREYFNDFFCDLRVTQVCTDGGEYDKLLEMFNGKGNWSNGTNSAESETDSKRVWQYCRPLLVSHNGSLTLVQQTFLDSCNITDSVDDWCGNYTLGISANASSPLSPFSVNPGKYHLFQKEWPARVLLDSFYLGIALLCVLMLCFFMRVVKDEGRAANDGFELVDTKSSAAAHTDAPGLQSVSVR